MKQSKWVYVFIPNDDKHKPLTWFNRFYSNTVAGRKRLCDVVMQYVYSGSVEVVNSQMYGIQHLRSAIQDGEINAANNLIVSGGKIHAFEVV